MLKVPAPQTSRLSSENLEKLHAQINEQIEQCADEHNEEKDDDGELQDGDSEEDDSHLLFPGFVETAFYCLPQENKIRKACLTIIKSPWFERSVILVILLNCVTLGMYQPCNDAKGCVTTRCHVLAVFDNIIYGFFFLEMVVKVIAMGFVGKRAYLDETWNRLDFFIIVAGAAEYGLGSGDINLSAIRTIRVLRPLRAINRIPSLRILVMLLLDTLPMLGNVLLICFFVFFIFGILGVQLWAGMLRRRCFMPQNMTDLIGNITADWNQTNPISPYYRGSWSTLEYICSMPTDSGMLTCADIEPLIVADHICQLNFTEETYDYLNVNFTKPDNRSCIDWNQYYTECKPGGPNPFREAISFDNIASSWIAIFQVISLEGWVDIMYYIQDAHSFWVWVYFLALIVIGAFFMVNLFLVVIATQFSETKRRETEKIAEERKRYRSSTTLTSTKTESTGCYAQILKYIIHVVKRTKRRVVRHYKAWKARRQKDPINASDTDFRLNLFGNHFNCTPCSHMVALIETYNAPVASPEPSDMGSVTMANVHHSRSPSLRRGSYCSRNSEPVIYLSMDNSDRETSFSLHQTSSAQCKSLQNGGLQVIVDANDCPENVALLKVVPVHSPLSRTRSANSRCYSPQPKHVPKPSPLLNRRDKVAPLTPEISANGHLSLRRSRSQGDRTPSSNHLTVPTSNNHHPRTVSNRLLIPNDMHGSFYSLQLKPSSNSPRNQAIPAHISPKSVRSEPLKSSRRSSAVSSQFKASLKQNHLTAESKKHSLSMISYLNARCDMNCSECQHECGEHKRQEAQKLKEEEKQKKYEKSLSGKVVAFRAKVSRIVSGSYFKNAILAAILFNTVMMGIEHHKQPPLLTDVVEISNYIFIGIFTIEMVMKLVADGFLSYIKDAMCMFDGFIVIMSYVELGMGNENSGLSVLRTFRLLRILKLIRFLPALQRQFVVMVRTLDNVTSFCGLLMLFMFIFSVLGMNLFGCLFCETNADGERECSRRNFDSLLWSLITVFQILTQEDWNTIMYEGMSRTTPWAALYFVALMTIGNYVLFNLLVAILVEGFSSVRGDTSTIPADDIEHEVLKHEVDMVRQMEGERAALPSIITDHAEIGNTNTDAQQFITTPIITRTEATPRGSPKSELASPTFPPNILSLDDQELDNLSSWNPFAMMSPAQPRKSQTSISSSPKLSRKGSHRSSKSSSKKDISEDRVLLMDEDENDDDVFVPLSSTYSHNSSIRNFDLLQVPAGSNIRQRSCDELSVKSEIVTSKANGSLSPLSIQIPDNHSECNGHIKHVEITGIRNLGEQTPLLTALNEDLKGGNGSVMRDKWRKKYLGSRSNVSLSNHSHDDDRQSVRSMRSVLSSNYHNHSDKQYPYSDMQMAEKQQEELEEEKNKENKSLLCQKLSRVCKPRGCLITRQDYSLYIFSPENKLRRVCTWIYTKKWFDYSVLVLIGLNCISLAVERPSIPPDSTERHILNYANYTFTLLFLLEMIVKVISQGLIIGPTTYLRSGWNVNDGFLVLVSCIDVMITWSLATSPKIFGVLRVLRLLRALRPLRVISRAPGLKLVVETLLSSLRPIGNIVLICLTFFLIFGILGVQLFKGMFYHCVGENIKHVTTRAECEAIPGNEWENEKYNFDNLGGALMSLFVLSSKDGWVMIMHTGLDAVGVDMQPIENYSEWRLLYFISFLLLVGFFVLNMFVGVVVENFHRCREVHEKEEKEKREQKRLRKLAKKIAIGKHRAARRKAAAERDEDEEIQSPCDDADGFSILSSSSYSGDQMNEPPYWASYGPRRLLFHKLVTNKYFDIAVAIIIFLNVISMAVEHYEMSDELMFALKVLNYVFTFIFILEAAFKVVALGLIRYIKERWNQLDVFIVFLSILGVVLEEVETEVIPINPTIIRVMRILRIARVLKLLKMAKGIRALLDTVLVALPQVGNLGLLFFLLFFIFAALGVELFGRIECSLKHPCEGMGVHANFENSGAAFLTLFRIATGDNWNGIMKDALREDCDNSEACVRNCCVNTVVTPIYFVVFVLTAQFVLVNVVVAVLMKHLEDAHFSVEDILLGRRLALTSMEGQTLENQMLTLTPSRRNSLQRELNESMIEGENEESDTQSDAESNTTGADSESDNAANPAVVVVNNRTEKLNLDSLDDNMNMNLHKPIHRQRSLPPNFKLASIT